MSMVQQKTQQPEHRNSLGYVIPQRGFGMSPEEAMIVWGIRADGTRLFIDAARRGAAEHLKCECGAELIARIGDVRAHHFAHASGRGTKLQGGTRERPEQVCCRCFQTISQGQNPPNTRQAADHYVHGGKAGGLRCLRRCPDSAGHRQCPTRTLNPVQGQAREGASWRDLGRGAQW